MKKINLIIFFAFLFSIPAIAGIFEEINGDIYYVEYDTLTRFRIGVYTSIDCYSFKANLDGTALKSSFMSTLEDINDFDDEFLGLFGASAGVSFDYFFKPNVFAKLSIGQTSYAPMISSDIFTAPYEDISFIDAEQKKTLRANITTTTIAPEIGVSVSDTRFSFVSAFNVINDISGSYKQELYLINSGEWDINNDYFMQMDDKFIGETKVIWEPSIVAAGERTYKSGMSLLLEVRYSFYSTDLISDASWHYNKVSFGANIGFNFGKRIHKTLHEKLPPHPIGYTRDLVSGYCERIKCEPGYAVSEITNECEPIICPSGFVLNMETNNCDTIPCPPGFAMNFSTGKCDSADCPLGYYMDFEIGECVPRDCEPGYKMNFTTGKCDKILCNPGYVYSVLASDCIPEIPKYKGECNGSILMIASFRFKNRADDFMKELTAKGITTFGIREGKDNVTGDTRYRIVSGCFDSEIDAFNAMDYFRMELLPKYKLDEFSAYMDIEVRD